MENLVESLPVETVECKNCGAEATSSSFVLRDNHPYKLNTAVICHKCHSRTIFSEDYEFLDYGVEIDCDLSNPKTDEEAAQNLSRIVMLNDHAYVSFIEDGKELFKFSTDRCLIETIEGTFLRAIEILESAYEVYNEYLKSICDTLRDLMKFHKGFHIIIKDETGFSRICPFRKEYTELQNNELETFNEESIKYKKFPNSRTKV